MIAYTTKEYVSVSTGEIEVFNVKIESPTEKRRVPKKSTESFVQLRVTMKDLLPLSDEAGMLFLKMTTTIHPWDNWVQDEDGTRLPLTPLAAYFKVSPSKLKRAIRELVKYEF